MAENVRTAEYLGRDTVGGLPCHHLAFTQDEVDWQLWVEVGERLLIRKVVITDKLVESRPQLTARFTRWNLSPRLPDLLFEFDPPEDAEEITFLPESPEETEEAETP